MSHERGDSEINAKKQRALAALLASPTKGAAAEAAGLSVKTLNRYMEDPEFSAAYKHAAGELMDRATRQLQQNLTSAVDRLAKIVANDDETSANHISAARTLLDYGLRFSEFNDVLKELEGSEGDNVL